MRLKVVRHHSNCLVIAAWIAAVPIAASLLAACGAGGRAAATTAPRGEAAGRTQEPAEGRGGASSAFHPSPPGALPVVIVPGISGSELASGPGDGAELLWPPLDAGRDRVGELRDFPGLLGLAAKTVNRLGKLSLADDLPPGSRPPVFALSVIPGRPSATGRIGSGDAYSALYLALGKARGSSNVYFFGYDWRRDNRESAAALEAFIIGVERERRVARVDIVAHSMGGLVATALLDRPGAAPRIRRLVLAGSPLAGSGSAFATLAGKSANPVFGFALPGPMGELAARDGTSLHDIGEGLDGTMRLLMLGYPSVYELLTPEDALRLGELGLPVSAEGRRASEAAASKAAAYRERITRRLPAICASARASGVEMRVMAGSGVKTLGRAAGSAAGGADSYVDGDADSYVDGDADSYVDGDGLVTAASAEAGGQLKHLAATFGVGHIGLVQDEACLAFIAGELSR